MDDCLYAPVHVLPKAYNGCQSVSKIYKTIFEGNRVEPRVDETCAESKVVVRRSPARLSGEWRLWSSSLHGHSIFLL